MMKKKALAQGKFTKQTILKKSKTVPGGIINKSVRNSSSFRIRLGVLVGKTFDPIPVGTHDRNYPKQFKIMNNTGPKAAGWGGMYHADVSTGLKIARMHPDIFKLDIMTGKQVTRSRLSRNHVNLNYYYDQAVSTLAGDKAHTREVTKAHDNHDCRVWPSGDYCDWIFWKSRYMKQLKKAGIPIIDTIHIENGFNPKALLRQIQAKGWDKFFIKGSYMMFFGNGAIHGKTQDFIDNPSLLENFVKENKSEKRFLVQPYMLKPDGKVFDEIRNFIIDGEWAYSVYTDGTEDEDVWEQPAGVAKEMAKKLAMRAYKEAAKVAKWHGKPFTSLMNRIDIGLIPDKSRKGGYYMFVNEIEPESATWLCRYCPFNLVDFMATKSVKKARQLLQGIIESGKKLPDKEKVRHCLEVLDQRLGPLQA